MKKPIVVAAITLFTLAILPMWAFAESVTFNLGQHVPVFAGSGKPSVKPTLSKALAEPISLGQYILERSKASSPAPTPTQALNEPINLGQYVLGRG